MATSLEPTVRDALLAELDAERQTLALYVTAEVRAQVIGARIDPLLDALGALDAVGPKSAD